MLTDSERQKDEILAISNILDRNEFRCKELGSNVQCDFNIFVSLIEDKIKITYESGNKCNSAETAESDVVSINHLPPIRLHTNIPPNYPSEEPPRFILSISWLPPWEISFVCQKLDEIWKENEGSEILFIWLEFLKNDMLTFLGISETLDISFMHMIYTDPKYYAQFRSMHITDERAANRGLLLDPIKFLKDYCKAQHKVHFEKQVYICSICFEKYNGKECIELENCGHVYCQECIKHYVTIKIDEAAVKNITCPNPTCNSELMFHEVRRISSDMAEKYENMLLQVTLSTMSDIVYCPRRTCQHPVVKDMNDSLVICDKCNYSFCSYCNKAYHGIAPCAMETDEIAKLIASYKKADKQQKKMLEKRYGRKQIEVIVENHLTREYIKEKTKPCPSCQASTQKVEGCNKMQCTYCQVAFCWLCGALIDTENAYDHFTQTGNTCYGRLFEGMAELNLEDMNVMDNVLWFNEQIEHIV